MMLQRKITQWDDAEHVGGFYHYRTGTLDGEDVEVIFLNLWAASSILVDLGILPRKFADIPDAIANVELGMFIGDDSTMVWLPPFDGYRPGWLHLHVDDLERFSDGSAALRQHSGLRMPKGKPGDVSAACAQMPPEMITHALALTYHRKQQLEKSIADMCWCDRCQQIPSHTLAGTVH